MSTECSNLAAIIDLTGNLVKAAVFREDLGERCAISTGSRDSLLRQLLLAVADRPCCRADDDVAGPRRNELKFIG